MAQQRCRRSDGVPQRTSRSHPKRLSMGSASGCCGLRPGGSASHCRRRRSCRSVVRNVLEEVDEGVEGPTLVLGQLRKHVAGRDRLHAAVFAEEE